MVDNHKFVRARLFEKQRVHLRSITTRNEERLFLYPLKRLAIVCRLGRLLRMQHSATEEAEVLHRLHSDVIKQPDPGKQ